MPIENSQKYIDPIYDSIEVIIRSYIKSLTKKASDENLQLNSIKSKLLEDIKLSENSLKSLQEKNKEVEDKYQVCLILLSNSTQKLSDISDNIVKYENILKQKKDDYEKIIQNISKNIVKLQKENKEYENIKTAIVSENKKLSFVINKNNDIIKIIEEEKLYLENIGKEIKEKENIKNEIIKKEKDIKDNISILKKESEEYAKKLKNVQHQYAIIENNLDTAQNTLLDKLDKIKKIELSIENKEIEFNKKIENKEKYLLEASKVNKAIIDDIKNKAKENEIYRNNLISIASDLLNSGADENKIRSIIAKLK